MVPYLRLLVESLLLVGDGDVGLRVLGLLLPQPRPHVLLAQQRVQLRERVHRLLLRPQAEGARPAAAEGVVAVGRGGLLARGRRGVRPVAAVEGDLLELEGYPVPQVVRFAQVLQRQRADLRLQLPLLS